VDSCVTNTVALPTKTEHPSCHSAQVASTAVRDQLCPQQQQPGSVGLWCGRNSCVCSCGCGWCSRCRPVRSSECQHSPAEYQAHKLFSSQLTGSVTAAAAAAADYGRVCCVTQTRARQPTLRQHACTVRTGACGRQPWLAGWVLQHQPSTGTVHAVDGGADNTVAAVLAACVLLG
jgi:hypothetical protein